MEIINGPHTGLRINVVGAGIVEITQILKKTGETTIYRTSLPDIVVKMYDLESDRNPEEISYGASLSYQVEVENFQDIRQIDHLRSLIPAFYGARMDEIKKYAFIAMEYLPGQDLQSWADDSTEDGFRMEWIRDFRKAIHETLDIIRRFHLHNIILIDFKADNVIRLYDGQIKFVDLGSFYTPRHSRETDKYVYSATPDYAELVIDTSNVQTETPLTEATDIFAAGVAMFEMCTGQSRLSIGGQLADELLTNSSIYLFRDSQIKDIWRSYHHLKKQLPTIETQLKERSILFSEFWHIIKGYAAANSEGWETMEEDAQHQIIYNAGRDFIWDQLPKPMTWLAEPIARATTLRRIRAQNIHDIMRLIADPIEAPVREDLTAHNCLVQYLRDFDQLDDFLDRLNSWEVRQHTDTERWAVAASAAARGLDMSSRLTFVKRGGIDKSRHKYYYFVSEYDADQYQGRKLTVLDLRDDPFAWIESRPVAAAPVTVSAAPLET